MTRSQHWRAVSAGTAYFAIVFTAGFVLGVIRNLVLIPWLGHGPLPVLLELPIILGISWLVCRWIVDRFDVPATTRARLVMGGLAFALLMIAEVALSTLALGRPFAAYARDLMQPAGLLGLAGQLLFAAFPLIQLRRR